tara:strand:- start:382 stop:597 length:216 start_codon:yes stop_codon:yes gene_type:complete
MLKCGIDGTGATRKQINGKPMEDTDMRTRWTDWIFATAVCIVFPVLIPITLLGVLILAVTSAMKTTPGDEI